MGFLKMRPMLPQKVAGSAHAAAALVALLTLNGFSTRIATAFDLSVGDGLMSLLGISAVIWFALFALFRIAVDEGGDPLVIAQEDKIPFLLAFLLCLLPLKEAAFVGIVAFPTYLVWTSVNWCARRRIGLIGLALSGAVFWGPLCASVFGPEVTALETQLLAALPNLTTSGNVIIAVDGETHFVVKEGCSALGNISLALVMTIVMAQLVGLPSVKRLGGWALLSVFAVIAVNSVRLAMYGYFPEQVDYLHDGGGKHLFSTAIFLLVTAIATFGALYENRRTL